MPEMSDGSALSPVLVEIGNVRQIPGEARRRWFSSAEFDLFVQCADGAGYVGFQLYYDKPHREHALLYSSAAGFRHVAVDDGEQRPGKYKASPVLVSDGVCDIGRLTARFAAACSSLPPDVADYVRTALARHPAYGGAEPEPG